MEVAYYVSCLLLLRTSRVEPRVPWTVPSRGEGREVFYIISNLICRRNFFKKNFESNKLSIVNFDQHCNSNLSLNFYTFVSNI